MAQRSIADLYYDSPVGTFSGNEVLPFDVPTVEEPTESSQYQSEGSLLSHLLAWILSNIPLASGTVAGLLSASNFQTINNLATVATSGRYADLSGTPSLAAVATTGAYGSLTGTPGVATDSTNGLLAASDKTKLDGYPQNPPTSLPPSGEAGGDLQGTYPNPELAETVSHGFAVAGPIAPESISTPAQNLGALAAASIANFTLGNHNYGTLQSTVNVTFTFTAPQYSGFCILTVFAPTTGTVPTVTLPANVVGTVQYPTALGQSTTTVFFYDGTNYCVVSSTPSH